MPRELVIIDGPDKGRRFVLEDGVTLIVGRGQASDTVINDPRMSRVHCRVQCDGDTIMLMDAGGSGGTKVAGRAVEQHELRPGELFQAGDTTLCYRTGQPGEDIPVRGDHLFGRPKPQPVITPLKDLVGQSLSSYRLDAIIAAGNSGMVFKATDTGKNQVAAVKVLTPDFAHQDEQRDRFVRAMKTMIDVRHPNIVRLKAAGKTGPYCWAAMEYVEGEDLLKVIDRLGVQGMLDWREVWRVAIHVGRALQHADELKVIHRNLTPTNILRRHSDKVCLVGDLMLAKALEGTLARQVTQPGQLIGEIPYLSPERTRDSGSVDGRSDIYSLGATLYALLTGKPPFQSNSLPELVSMVRTAEPLRPSASQMSINELFEAAVLKMLSKDPSDRFQGAGPLLVELERIGKHNRLEADWSGWVG